MFRSTTPVIEESFFGRDEQMQRLASLADDLVERQAPRWLALLGQRRIGKTSLLSEMERRLARPGLAFVMLDLLERLPASLEVFRTCALRTLDALVGTEVGLSVERIAGRPEYASRVLSAPSIAALPERTRDLIAELPTLRLDSSGLAACLRLPELLATALDRHVLVAWDEFQELASLRGAGDVMAAMRSAWQHHLRVAYVISGSAPTLLRELVSSEGSPFFMHVDVVELGPLGEREAIDLVLAGGEGLLDEVIARRLFATVGGHPFYLQVCGEELLRQGAPCDDGAVKEALQRVLFTSTGRLSLYFERQHAALVGRSGFAAATLAALAGAHHEGLRLADVAQAIGAPAGDSARYLERLGDAVIKGGDRRYRLADPTFALWIRWREPRGGTVPMAVLGDEGERAVAERLGRMGFDLVYQSRASRGAFDLLAIRGAAQLGIQVRRRGLPLRFSPDEWSRMEAEALRLRWAWIVAAVDPGGEVVLLDPALAARRRTVRMGPEAVIDNLLRWLDERH